MPKGFTPIPAPQNRQPTTGLVALAAQAAGVPEEWEAGFAFAPESCDRGQVLAYGCGATTTKEAVDKPALVEYMPASLVVVDFCSTMGGPRDPAIARRLLLNQQSALLEQLLWTGVAAGDPALVPGTSDNRPHLADSRSVDLNGGTAISDLPHALAVMDQALTACLNGVAGNVHMTPYLLARLVEIDALVRDGARWVTPNGHTVIAGAGYTGGGPRDQVGGTLPAAPDLLATPPANQWFYGTGPVFYLLGAVDELEDVNWRVNSSYVTDERPGAAFYGCCHFAAQVDLTPT